MNTNTENHAYKNELKVVNDIALEAGNIMLEYFDNDLQIETKEDKSSVTIADKLINSLVIKKLAEAFPQDGVIGEEESTSEYGMGRKWICDPIDGTAGYIIGTPTAMFSLALVVDGRPVLGVAYDPFLKKMYVGMKDFQSECNGKKLQVSKLTLQEGMLGVTGSVKRLTQSSYFQKLLDDKVKLACFSGAVYKACLITRGRLVGHIEPGANAHDLAAIHSILEGAGGKITSVDGGELDYSKPFKGGIMSNGVVHDKLIEYFKIV